MNHRNFPHKEGFVDNVAWILHFQGSGGSAPDAYPYAPKRSRSLDKRGSKSLDSTNDGKDGVASRRMSTIGSMSGTSGCNIGRFRTLNSMKFRIIFD